MAKRGRWTAVDYRANGLDLSGELAVRYGRLLVTYAPTGETPVTDSGNFMHVWRRQADGTWRLARDISNFVPQRASSAAAPASR